MTTTCSQSILAIPNIRLFIWYRIFFGARFYYPVFAILFLDYGLTLQHFAVLNTVWAITIVLLEVPSGALADVIGRKPLIVIATGLMILEMLVLVLVPVGNIGLVFWAFFLNRVLSGAAEAAASGSDEALAYDSMAAAGRSQEWPHVLDLQMRWHAGAMMCAMVIGAAVYDPHLVHRLTGWQLPQDLTMRFPIYLTTLTGIAALVTVLRMRDVRADRAAASPQTSADSPSPAPKRGHSVSGMVVTVHRAALATLHQIMDAGRWVLATPFALVIIAAALSFDSVTRLFLTISSKYYRLIQIPEGSFGLISASLATLGFFTPMLARWLVRTQNRHFNFFLLAAMTLVGLGGMGMAWPWWGLVWVVPTVASFYLATFFASHYLNEITDSQRRATVLSFRSLAQNLAYGFINILFALVMLAIQHRTPDIIDPFGPALRWLPAYFAVVVIGLVLFGRRMLRRV